MVFPPFGETQKTHVLVNLSAGSRCFVNPFRAWMNVSAVVLGAPSPRGLAWGVSRYGFFQGKLLKPLGTPQVVGGDF